MLLLLLMYINLSLHIIAYHNEMKNEEHFSNVKNAQLLMNQCFIKTKQKIKQTRNVLHCLT